MLPSDLDPGDAAYWAIIATCLVLLGAIVTPGTLSVEQRGPVLAGVITTLFVVAYRVHRSRHKGPPG